MSAAKPPQRPASEFSPPRPELTASRSSFAAFTSAQATCTGSSASAGGVALAGPATADTRRRHTHELPTWLLIVAIYPAWLAITAMAAHWPLWLLPLLLGPLLCLHGSLQHEASHGHPTRNPRLNALLAGLPLSLWLPFPRYRESHLAHHEATLTDPREDSESWYLGAAEYAACGAATRALLRCNNSLLGRWLLGPWIALWRFARGEWRLLRAGDRAVRRVWLWHLAACAPLLLWLEWVGLPLWQYLLLGVWPGLSLTLTRSFHEHRADADPERRTAVVEAGPLFRLLFLNNNYHVMHHRHPELPWYELPACYRSYRAALQAGELGYLPGGYARIARRYLLRSVDGLLHPNEAGREPG